MHHCGCKILNFVPHKNSHPLHFFAFPLVPSFIGLKKSTFSLKPPINGLLPTCGPGAHSFRITVLGYFHKRYKTHFVHIIQRYSSLPEKYELCQIVEAKKNKMNKPYVKRPHVLKGFSIFSQEVHWQLCLTQSINWMCFYFTPWCENITPVLIKVYTVLTSLRIHF